MKQLSVYMSEIAGKHPVREAHSLLARQRGVAMLHRSYTRRDDYQRDLCRLVMVRQGLHAYLVQHPAARRELKALVMKENREEAPSIVGRGSTWGSHTMHEHTMSYGMLNAMSGLNGEGPFKRRRTLSMKDMKSRYKLSRGKQPGKLSSAERRSVMKKNKADPSFARHSKSHGVRGFNPRWRGNAPWDARKVFAEYAGTSEEERYWVDGEPMYFPQLETFGWGYEEAKTAAGMWAQNTGDFRRSPLPASYGRVPLAKLYGLYTRIRRRRGRPVTSSYMLDVGRPTVPARPLGQERWTKMFKRDEEVLESMYPVDYPGTPEDVVRRRGAPIRAGLLRGFRTRRLYKRLPYVDNPMRLKRIEPRSVWRPTEQYGALPRAYLPYVKELPDLYERYTPPRDDSPLGGPGLKPGNKK